MKQLFFIFVGQYEHVNCVTASTIFSQKKEHNVYFDCFFEFQHLRKISKKRG